MQSVISNFVLPSVNAFNKHLLNEQRGSSESIYCTLTATVFLMVIPLTYCARVFSAHRKRCNRYFAKSIISFTQRSIAVHILYWIKKSTQFTKPEVLKYSVKSGMFGSWIPASQQHFTIVEFMLVATVSTLNLRFVNIT